MELFRISFNSPVIRPISNAVKLVSETMNYLFIQSADKYLGRWLVI